MDISDSEMLLPVELAFQAVTEVRPSPSTQWRFIKHGVAGPDGERIRLSVVYLGRKPCTTRTAVLQWLDAVTQARLAKIDRKRSHGEDVSDDELRAAGLLGRNDGGAK